MFVQASSNANTICVARTSSKPESAKKPRTTTLTDAIRHASPGNVSLRLMFSKTNPVSITYLQKKIPLAMFHPSGVLTEGEASGCLNLLEPSHQHCEIIAQRASATVRSLGRKDAAQERLAAIMPPGD